MASNNIHDIGLTASQLRIQHSKDKSILVSSNQNDESNTVDRTPLHIFNDIYYKRMRSYQLICGVDYITNAHFRPIALTWFWIGVNLLYFLSFVYTIATYDSVTVWKSLTLVGLAVQGIVKYVVMLRNATNIHRQFRFLENIYKSNMCRSQRAYDILKRFVRIAEIIVKCGAVIIMGSLIGLFATSTVMSVVDGKRNPLFEAYLPFVDETTDSGFAILTLFHLLGIFLSGYGTCCIDLLLILYVIHVKVMADIFADHLDQLNEALVLCVSDSRRHAEQVAVFLRNIIMIHEDICR